MEQQPYSGVENLEVMSEARNYNDYLLRTVRSHARPGDRILDFGAGGGQFAVPLSNAGLDVTALEPDGALRNRIAARGVATVANLDAIQDESLDYIYTLNVLEHIEDHDRERSGRPDRVRGRRPRQARSRDGATSVRAALKA